MSRDLLFSLTEKDFDIDWFSGTGAGGQHRNRKKSCCRLTHAPSGVTKVGANHRSRTSNKRDAFKALTSDGRFKAWVLREANASSSLSLEEKDCLIEQRKDESTWDLVCDQDALLDKLLATRADRDRKDTLAAAMKAQRVKKESSARYKKNKNTHLED